MWLLFPSPAGSYRTSTVPPHHSDEQEKHLIFFNSVDNSIFAEMHTLSVSFFFYFFYGAVAERCQLSETAFLAFRGCHPLPRLDRPPRTISKNTLLLHSSLGPLERINLSQAGPLGAGRSSMVPIFGVAIAGSLSTRGIPPVRSDYRWVPKVRT
jgi:hypothetical protein